MVTWSCFIRVAFFVINAFVKTIVGWRMLTKRATDLSLASLEQALWDRPANADLIHLSAHGSQYQAIDYSNRLADAGVTASAGTVGDAHENALAETINWLCETEMIWKLGGQKDQWVDRFNNRRLMSSLGYAPLPR